MKFLGVPSSGSIAGTTSSHNRAGQYTRNRRVPVQPVGTGRRGVIRTAFGTSAKGYAALTAAQQSAWAAYAESYPVTDRLGQSIKLTAQNMYISIGTQLINCGQPLPTDPPSSNAVSAIGLTALTLDSSGTMVITLDGSGSADDFITIAFSSPRSSGVSFCKTFWQQTVVAANATTVATPGVAYTAQFGTAFAGQRVFYKFTPVNQYGVTGTPLIGFITVT